MKICQLTQEFFLIFGIIPQKFIRKRPFNKRGILMLFLHNIHIVSYCLFIFRGAKTFKECTDGVYMAAAAVSAAHVYVTCLTNSGVYFDCIKFFDDTINKSETTTSKLFFAYMIRKSVFTQNFVKKLAGLAYSSSKSIYKTFSRYVETFSKCVLDW